MAVENEYDADIEALISTIDESTDPVHAGFTPSVVRLAELGLRGARAVVHLLDAPEFITRRHAYRVLEEVVKQRHGWVSGQGYLDAAGQEKTAALLKANGDYRPNAPANQRKRAIEKWRRWLESQSK